MSKPKILEQIENAGGVFIATKDTTTYQEIKDAYDSGKDVIVPYGREIYELTTIPTGTNSLYFDKRSFINNDRATTYSLQLSISTTNVWGGPVINIPTQAADAIYYNFPTTVTSSTGYYRPIRISTTEPTASDGNIGDIWIQYEDE